MAGGALKYRHLDRNSSHRQALLRNLVTSLITHESIKTTWPKAKEAQRLAEKLITLGKKNTNASRAKAQAILFVRWYLYIYYFRGSLSLTQWDTDEGFNLQEPFKNLPIVFGPLRERYELRRGGYTRVLRIEPLNRHHDQAPSAILELVDGPRDMRFAMTAKTLVRERANKGVVREITARNVAKVTRFRRHGKAELERMVKSLRKMKELEKSDEKEEKSGKGGEEKRLRNSGEDKEREPWKPYPRMRQEEREKKNEGRPLTDREKRERRRTRRNPHTGRRTKGG